MVTGMDYDNDYRVLMRDHAHAPLHRDAYNALKTVVDIQMQIDFNKDTQADTE